MTDQPRYVPAAGRRSLTALYDPVMRLTMREATFRGLLVDQVLAGPAPAQVVDVGCGTGSLAIALAAAAPGVAVTGVDGDEAVLRVAREKAARAGSDLNLSFVRGLAQALPLEDAFADRVVCSLMLHHLAPGAKASALREIHRILVPGGELHVADWGRPHDLLMRVAFVSIQLLDGFEATRDHVAGRLPALLEQAGFAPARVRERLRTPWGTLELLSCGRRGV